LVCDLWRDALEAEGGESDETSLSAVRCNRKLSSIDDLEKGNRDAGAI
jgi:hypothetical protein